MEDEEGYVSEDETSDSSSDDEEIVDVPDKDFFKTLSCLKNKDPRIYDKSVEFFSKNVETETNNDKHVVVEKPVYVKDYVIGSINGDSSEEESKPVELTYAAEQEATKQFFKNELANESSSDDESSEGLMKIKVKSIKDKEEEEADYIQFLKGNRTELGDKEEEEDLKPLYEYWNNKGLDENEVFLKDYILNKRYLSKESEEEPNIENLSEDERELEEQAQFEDRYNRRFETEENLQIKRFPRQVEGSLRRKDDSRKKKRAEIAQRKAEEKVKKQQEIKKQQKEKLAEIEARIKKLKELTGNQELGFKDEEILEDFDPDKHDKKMNEYFNEDFYNQDEVEHPGFDENDYNWDYGDINMDCEENNIDEKNKKLTRSKKKKLKKKKAFTDIMDIAKPSFDPQVHKDFKKYLDEYYNLDCEDFIDDLPCRFKYREVVPNDYGLTVEEILMADDSELNQWASIKKICKRRPEHVEKNEVKIYSKKAKDENLKRKIFHSLYAEEREDQDSTEALLHSKKMSEFSNNVNKKSIKKSKDISDSRDGSMINIGIGGEENFNISMSNNCNGKDHKLGRKDRKRKLNAESTENVSELHDNSSFIEKVPESVEKKKRKKNKHSESVIESSDRDNSSHPTEFSCFEGKDNYEKECQLVDTLENKDTHSNINCKKSKKHFNESNLENKESFIGSNSFSDSKSIEENTEKPVKNLYQIKNKKKKKKKHSNVLDTSNVKCNNVASNKNENSNKDKNLNKSFLKNNRRGKGFKQSKSRDVTDLSDNRLLAYGLKPKKFRAKLKYSKKAQPS